MVTYQIVHRTTYEYDADVVANYSEAHLLPRTTPEQEVVGSALVVEPAPVDQRERTDFYGNRVVHVSIDEPHRHLAVTATSTVVVHDRAGPPLGLVDDPWDVARDRLDAEAGSDEPIPPRAFVLESPLLHASTDVAAYAAPSFPPGRPTVEAVLDLVGRIHRDFAYEPGATTSTTPLTEVLERRAGVCQDFAHLAVAAVRSVGLPARYVSGYLETDPPPGREKMLGADASHAWGSVFVPGWGWLDVDPTNDKVPDERYITTAWGRDYADVTPLKGVVFSSSAHPELRVAVDVLRVPA